MRYLFAPVIVALIVLVGLFAYTQDFDLVCTAAVLAIVEISLSFDNAVVNAAKLKDMSPIWQRIFMTVGIVIAVLGMRFFLPLLIVDIVGNTGFVNALNMAQHDHEQFRQILTSAHHIVAGFGGMFLLLTALEYFLDQEKETHWLTFIEPGLAKSAFSNTTFHYAIALAIGFIFWAFTKDMAFIFACFGGMILFAGVKLIQWLLELFDNKLGNSSVLSAGLMAFVYLEILDASFSFDGVIAAFAISKDIIVVAVGLGIGAMFVRALTVHLVKTGTLAEYKFLENGAFWSIFTLAILMFISASIDIPEFVTGMFSFIWIASAYLSSVRWKQVQTNTV